MDSLFYFLLILIAMGGELQDHHFDGLFLCTEHQIDFGDSV